MKNLLLTILILSSILSFGQTQPITTNDAFVSSSSEGIRLIGTATQFDDLMFPFTTGTNGSNTYPVFSADSMYYSFVTDTTGVSKCEIYMILQLPHSVLENSVLYPHVHYKHTTAQGTPTFKVRYKTFPISGTTAKNWKWYKMDTTTGTTNNSHQIVSGSGSIAGNTISSIIVVQVYLASQTGTGGIYAWQFDIHFEKNTIGSRTPSSK